jgi:hypothetical protein
MENENVMAGYAIDPHTVYGNSLHQQVPARLDSGDESARIVEDSPVAGPSAVGDASAGRLPGVVAFVRSPVGLLVILLPVAYWLFNEVYA